MTEQLRAESIIESLRFGIPPTRGVEEYSAGNEGFLTQIRKRHLRPIAAERGKIRFVSGSWGSGKTHFFAQLREMAFDSRYLVATVTLKKDETPFNRFEEVFYRIVKEISSPEIDTDRGFVLDTPLAEVLRRQLFLGRADAENAAIERETYDKACDELMANTGIDIDFRRLVCQFWATYLPEAGDPAMREDRRGRIMQWFSGEGTATAYRKEFGVGKVINRSNARTLLRSLARYTIDAGYSGILILFDETEMSHSAMRSSELIKAFNNLLHLVNSVEDSPGLFLIYATTPDFYTDQHHGIETYGALSSRVGRPPERPPRALDRVWNLDYAQPNHLDYHVAAQKIRDLYIAAYPEHSERLSGHTSLDRFVQDLIELYPRFGAVGFWRVLVTAVVRRYDWEADGEVPPSPEDLYDDIIAEIGGS